MAADALVLKHQDISIHNTDTVTIVLDHLLLSISTFEYWSLAVTMKYVI